MNNRNPDLASQRPSAHGRRFPQPIAYNFTHLGILGNLGFCTWFCVECVCSMKGPGFKSRRGTKYIAFLVRTLALFSFIKNRRKSQK